PLGHSWQFLRRSPLGTGRDDRERFDAIALLIDDAYVPGTLTPAVHGLSIGKVTAHPGSVIVDGAEAESVPVAGKVRAPVSPVAAHSPDRRQAAQPATALWMLVRIRSEPRQFLRAGVRADILAADTAAVAFDGAVLLRRHYP